MKLGADRTNEAESSFDVEGPRCGNDVTYRNFNREVRSPDNGAQRVVRFSSYTGVCFVWARVVWVIFQTGWDSLHNSHEKKEELAFMNKGLKNMKGRQLH